MKKIIFILTIFLLIGCTGNERVRKFGGTQTIELAPNHKLINITWKDNDMWILTRQMNKNDIAETFEFQENSNYGVLDGKVVLVEKKQ